MTIMGKGFDLEAIRKARARRAASGGVDLVEAINAISDDIGKLKPGQTAQVAIAEGQTVRKAVMNITAKLNNLTPKGAPWEGRQYKVISDGEGFVYVQRGEDRAPVERKQRAPRSSAAPASGTETVTAKDGAVTREMTDA